MQQQQACRPCSVLPYMSSQGSWPDYLEGAHGCVWESVQRRLYLTSKHSCSLTVFAALIRLGIVPTGASCDSDQPYQCQTQTQGPECTVWEPGTTLRLTVAGAGQGQGLCADDTAGRFCELFRLLSAAGVTRVRLLITGAGVPSNCQGGTISLPGGHRTHAQSWMPGNKQPLNNPTECQPQLARHCTAVQDGKSDDCSIKSDYYLEHHLGLDPWADPNQALARLGQHPRRKRANKIVLQGALSQPGHDRKKHPLNTLDTQGSAVVTLSVQTTDSAPPVPYTPSKPLHNQLPAMTVRVVYCRGRLHEQPKQSIVPASSCDHAERPGVRTSDSPAWRATQEDLDSCGCPPHLVVCFNAGVWGYGKTWTDQMEWVTSHLKAPVLITSYSFAQAEDDQETVDDANLACASWAWGAEPNPWASLRPRKPTPLAALASVNMSDHKHGLEGLSLQGAGQEGNAAVQGADKKGTTYDQNDNNDSCKSKDSDSQEEEEEEDEEILACNHSWLMLVPHRAC